jgi:hypothetical protein
MGGHYAAVAIYSECGGASMRADGYLKVVLTVIALELLWIGAKTVAVPVSAQDAPTRVVITGIEMDTTRPAYLPVAIVGSVRTIPAPLRVTVESLRLGAPVEVDTQLRPLRIDTDRPLKIEADKPLKVETVRYTPGARPGE